MRADELPGMTGERLHAYLQEVGRNWTGEGVAVECGCWLGASSAALLAGLVEAGYDRTFYAYDGWTASAEEVGKAAAQGVELHEGQNLEPLYRANVEPVYADIETQRGKIELQDWCGEDIEVFVLDAVKRDPGFSQVLEKFGRCWIPDVTVVGLLDFHIYRKFGGRYRDQLDWMQGHAHHFEFLRDFEHHSSAVFFRYKGGLWTT